MPRIVLSKYNIVKKFFFHERTEWCSFHKIPDFSCTSYVKKVFLVHLFENALICGSTVLECSCCRIHRYVAAPFKHIFYRKSLKKYRWRIGDCSLRERQWVVFISIFSNENYFFCRPVIVFLGAIAVVIHLTLFFLPSSYFNVLLFIRYVGSTK